MLFCSRNVTKNMGGFLWEGKRGYPFPSKKKNGDIL